MLTLSKVVTVIAPRELLMTSSDGSSELSSLGSITRYALPVVQLPSLRE